MVLEFEDSTGNRVRLKSEEWHWQSQRISEDQRFITDVYQAGSLEIVRECDRDPSCLSVFRLCMSVANRGGTPIRLHRFVPILAEGSDCLHVGSGSAGEWSFMRSGRQKNDLPSVCVLGRFDGAYTDSLGSLSEAGRRGKETADAARQIVSDELSVIVAKEGDGPGSVLIGFLDGRSYLAECRIKTDSHGRMFESLEAACLLDGVLLQPDELRQGEWLMLDGQEPFKAIESFVEQKSKLLGTTAAPHPPTVYCTWYYYGDTISQGDVDVNLNAIIDRRVPVDVIQIDEGWERRLGDWEPNHRFPDGMEAIAQRIRVSGYRPGIWTAPFIIEPRQELRYHRHEWLLKDEYGQPVTFFMNNMNNFVLDVTHPGVLEWIEALYRKLTAWGYTYHKLDFTRAIAPDSPVRYHRPDVTRAEAFRLGVEAVRKGVGRNGYVLICGGLYSPPAGLVDGHRSGSDVRSMWSERKGSRGKVAPFTIKQNVLRYWMAPLWHNDPDALMVRRQTESIRALDLSFGLLTDDEARVSALNQYMGGGIVCFTEPMAEIDRDRLGLLRHVSPALGRAAVPRDMLEGKRYAELFDVEVDCRVSGLGLWHTISTINWQDDSQRVMLTLDERLLGDYAKQYESYAIADFWSGRIWRGVTYGAAFELGELASHACHHIKVIPERQNHPTVLYTNGHFSMGGREFQSLTMDGNRVVLQVEWVWDYPFRAVLAAPPGRAWAVNQPEGVCLSEERGLLEWSAVQKTVQNLVFELD
jgi:hypothetical protein